MMQFIESLRIIGIALCVFTTVVWGGVAMMLWLATGANGWALWAIPLAPLTIVAFILLWPFMMKANRGFSASVKKQIDKDLQLFDEIL
jgi:hypothetical protein